MGIRLDLGRLVITASIALAACGDNHRPPAGEIAAVITPLTGLETSESGAQATFTIALGSRPSGDVVIPLASSVPTEGTIDRDSVTFTPMNWDAPQRVTITGVDDAVADGAQPYTIVTSVVVTDDTRFDGLDPADVSVTNIDNDSPSILVTPTTGLVTTESGGTATFTVALASAPTADVTIAIGTNDSTEGVVTPASLTFTPLNYNAPQTVTVLGVDDNLEDGAQTYLATTAAAVSDDAGYNGVDADDVEISNTDNDTAGITVTPTQDLVTTESGGQATFAIVLNSEPTSDVTIPLSSSDPTEGTADAASLTFTPANWNAPQTVTVTGIDDAVADGSQLYSILTGPATTTDPMYSAIDAPDVQLSNTDNDSPGVTVAGGPVQTTEGGGQDSFTIVLNSEPTDDVTFAVASSDVGEGTVGAASVTFTPANWNAPQSITVTGVDDSIADGNQPYTIQLAAATSNDAGYAGVDPADVAATNVDDDSAGFLVTPTTGLSTTEAGGTATFEIVLTSQPSADVTVGVSSNDTTEGTTDVASVTFTMANWNAPQTVTITGVDDAVADGNQPYRVELAPATSTDTTYAGIDPTDVAVTNVDNDSASIAVSPLAIQTTEAGAQATFTIVLNSQPTANVTIPLSSDDTTEGTISVASVTFTPANWNAPQTVTVTGVDDAVSDGNQVFSIVTAAATSTDAGYGGLDAADVTVTNIDNDSASIIVSPTSGLSTTESGGQATFTIVLSSEPLSDVTIPLASSDVGEGTVAPASVTFTIANWNAPRTVTVTGVDDATADGNQPYTITTAPAISADPSYVAMDAANVSLTNIDNDTAGFIVTPTSGLVTTESGGQATFTIALASEPTANVTFALASNDSSEGTVSPQSVTFTPLNWNAPRTITVTGVNDAIADGNQLYAIRAGAATSTDPGYSGRVAPSVSVTNTDNDTAGIIVTPTTGLQTSELGGQATFTVVLRSQPTASVTVGVASSDPTEGTASTASLVFTTANWNAPQTVTITGVDDAIADGDQPYTINLAPATSTDAQYNGIDAVNPGVTNLDDDSAAIVVAPTTGQTTEAGGQATFTVVLTSQPSANVTIALTTSDASEGTPAPASLTFTPTNWNASQTVTVTGADDSIDDGNQVYQVRTGAATSTDPSYSGLDAADVSLTNLDNDTAGVIVNPTSGLTTTEAGGQATFAIVLQSQPAFNVVIPLSSSDTTEGTVTPTSVTFTTVNWNAPQTVTITGVNDAVADGNQPYTINVGSATSSDASYNGIDPANVSVTNTDNDSAGITVSPTAGLSTTEGGGQATFTVVLTSQPVAAVTVGLSSTRPLEGTVSTPSLTFTTANWNAPQTVTVTGQDDLVADGNQAYSIVTAAATSADPAYAGLDPANVSLTNIDNDSAGIIVTPVSGLTTSEGGGVDLFTIQLASQPTADVTIGVASSDPSEGATAVASVTFTSANWNQPQSVSITGVNDAITDGNQPYTIVTSPATSADATYNGLDAPNVSVTNLDDDIAGYTVEPTSGIFVSEFGDFDTFTVVLNTAPTADVVIPVSSSDATEGTVSPASLTFTTANWNVPQTVTVTGVNDNLADGNQVFFAVLGVASSSDPNYGGTNPPDVEITNVDNDTPQVYVKARRLLRTSENGQGSFFRVALTTQPLANVTCTFGTTDTTEGTLSPTTLTFTPANFATLQQVNVSGVDDAVLDGDQLYTIQTFACTSADPAYDGMDPRDLSVINRDNE